MTEDDRAKVRETATAMGISYEFALELVVEHLTGGTPGGHAIGTDAGSAAGAARALNYQAAAELIGTHTYNIAMADDRGDLPSDSSGGCEPITRHAALEAIRERTQR